MKAFIWSSEYVVHIAVANTIGEAKALLLNNKAEVGHFSNELDAKNLDEAFLNEPLIVEANSSLHITHANQ